MDPTLALILGALWFLVNLLARKKKTPPPPTLPRRTPAEPPGQTARDATQVEGSRLQIMLREFERALEEGKRSTGYLDAAEDIEERESLEREPEVVSLEHEIRRAPRKDVTQDEGAEKLVEKRIAAAAARDSARSTADHVGFDQKIRQEPADHTATRGYTPKQLRDAVVWREILGPPASER